MNSSSIPVSNTKKAGPDQLDQKVQASWQEVQDSIDTMALNPVLGMHRSPRKTLEAIYRLNYPIVWPFLIMACAGIAHSLNQFVLGSDLTVNSLITSIGFGAIAGPLVGMLAALMITYSGKLLGGTGSFKRVLVAWGWSSAPSMFILIIWGLRFAIVGPEFFDNQIVTESESGLGSRAMIYLTMFSAGLMMWQMALTVTAVSEAHQFGLFRALGSLIGMFLVLLLVFSFV